MSNPATELHSAFMSWKEANNSRAVSLSSIVKLETLRGAEELVRVFSLLRMVKDGIDRAERETGDDLTMFRNAYPEWVKIAAGFSHGWQSTAVSSSFVPDLSMQMLNALALYLNGKVFELPANAREHLPETLVEARNLLLEVDDLPQPLRLYLNQLIAECETALSNDRLGSTFDFESAVMRLYTAFQAAGLTVQDTAKKRSFFTFATDVLRAAAIDSGTKAISRGGEAGLTALIELSSKAIEASG